MILAEAGDIEFNYLFGIIQMIVGVIYLYVYMNLNKEYKKVKVNHVEFSILAIGVFAFSINRFFPILYFKDNLISIYIFSFIFFHIMLNRSLMKMFFSSLRTQHIHQPVILLMTSMLFFLVDNLLLVFTIALFINLMQIANLIFWFSMGKYGLYVIEENRIAVMKKIISFFVINVLNYGILIFINDFNINNLIFYSIIELIASLFFIRFVKSFLKIWGDSN
jgi:hypothetical protein